MKIVRYVCFSHVFSLHSEAWRVKVVVLELLIRAVLLPPSEASCTGTYHIETSTGRWPLLIQYFAEKALSGYAGLNSGA